ncbi:MULTISPECIES: phosphoribosylamine--glycine ligase [Thalassospira]|uniref:phosphoribosylamine--glycine ligase n=1 Tax=Thalassospira TaxID=168934 RepID=UPI0008DC88A1|nr:MULTISPECIES: phosphoribosylamine--glycine ligase [Thalassospira]MAB34897.1 phosphoribosylamine--glycine ligase [Thalassospira sp.]MDM7976067.1 phosphoribosylamine--glycine ligase [Thalassospira xiamenensis]OHZ04439.1 phosphoribosylamine--glycine ligase [Thalassospira sp. MIT1004]HBS22866.1 phosphoribosylamine--glycine ligase [Thalassospira sp.]
MKVLVVGGGGREHALCWAIAKSPRLTKLWCAPGNAGIADSAECVAISDSDIDGLVKFANDNAVDLVVVGPEAPLVAGLVDALDAVGIKSFGCSKAAAQLEGSKGFMKDMVAKFGVPSAAYGRFTTPDDARAFVEKHGAPIVVKTDGLAAGKGVTICQTVDEALAAIDECMVGGKFGDAGAELVIEEFMTGEEASFFAVCDGENVIPLIAAQDHKAVGEGDTGPNTGGMGAYSPAPVFTKSVEDKVMEQIIVPTVKGMAAEGHPFKGVLFAGLMIDDAGNPKLIEYNIRFGDPECQVLMTRLKSDVIDILDGAASGELDKVKPEWHDETAMVVVMAAKGYPGSYDKGTEIRNVADADAMDKVKVLHAGTKMDGDKLTATGGRVLGVTARGTSVTEAQKRAYEAVDAINWPGGFCRRDIGWRAIAREQK